MKLFKNSEHVLKEQKGKMHQELKINLRDNTINLSLNIMCSVLI